MFINEETLKILKAYTGWLMDTWNPNQLYIPFADDAPNAFAKYINDNNMTREKAVIELKKGNKIKHQKFTDNEFLYYRDDEIITEDGYVFDSTFYGLDLFKDGWYIYND